MQARKRISLDNSVLEKATRSYHHTDVASSLCAVTEASTFVCDDSESSSDRASVTSQSVASRASLEALRVPAVPRPDAEKPAAEKPAAPVAACAEAACAAPPPAPLSVVSEQTSEISSASAHSQGPRHDALRSSVQQHRRQVLSDYAPGVGPARRRPNVSGPRPSSLADEEEQVHMASFNPFPPGTPGAVAQALLEAVGRTSMSGADAADGTRMAAEAAPSPRCSSISGARPIPMRRSVSMSEDITAGSEGSPATTASTSPTMVMQSFLYTPRDSAAAQQQTAASALCPPLAPRPATPCSGRGRASTALAPSTLSDPQRRSSGEEVPIEEREMRVLVAEDNRINQLVVQKVLKRVVPRCTIDIVEDGEAALQAILERPLYDLVLMDLHMPRMDGLEAARRVRQTNPSKPRIVALTADTLVGVAQRCEAAGMDDYVAKPFHVDDMRRILSVPFDDAPAKSLAAGVKSAAA